jgi:hypothetical protein
MADQPSPRRRFQFSMRQLFAAVGWVSVAMGGVRLCLIDLAYFLPASFIIAMAVVATIGTFGFRMGCWTLLVVAIIFVVVAVGIILANLAVLK